MAVAAAMVLAPGGYYSEANVPLGPPLAADPLNATAKGALVAALTEM